MTEILLWDDDHAYRVVIDREHVVLRAPTMRTAYGTYEIDVVVKTTRHNLGVHCAACGRRIAYAPLKEVVVIENGVRVGRARVARQILKEQPGETVPLTLKRVGDNAVCTYCGAPVATIVDGLPEGETPIEE